jgi:hypothetical protein
MGTEPNQGREVRAARNQALFRSVNEKMRKLNESVATLTGAFSISCECADTHCITMIEIPRYDYLAVRSEPRHFVVVPGHVIPEIETVVREADGYVVVEKTDTAGEVAETSAPEAPTSD